MGRIGAWLAVGALLSASAVLGAVVTLQWMKRDDDARQPAQTSIETAPTTLASPGRRPVSGGEPELATTKPAPISAARDKQLTELNKQAIEALNAREFERAIELFERCHTADPDPVFALNLAEALARHAVARHETETPCATCIEEMQRAHELAPNRDDIQTILERWKREAEIEKDFWHDSSLHFELSYDGNREDILSSGNKILNSLEDDYGELVRFFGSAPVEEGRPRIAVTLYRREGFHEITALGDWAGGAFDGVVRVPIGDYEREAAGLERVMKHELVHAFVRVIGGANVPGWLNEGVAQWLEPNRSANLDAARRHVKGQTFFPVERLKGTLATWKDKDEIGRAYAQSLLMVDWMVQRYGERVLLDVIEECKSTAPDVSFERSTHVPLQELIDDLAQSL